MVTVIYWS